MTGRCFGDGRAWAGLPRAPRFRLTYLGPTGFSGKLYRRAIGRQRVQRQTPRAFWITLSGKTHSLRLAVSLPHELAPTTSRGIPPPACSASCLASLFHGPGCDLRPALSRALLANLQRSYMVRCCRWASRRRFLLWFFFSPGSHASCTGSKRKQPVFLRQPSTNSSRWPTISRKSSGRSMPRSKNAIYVNQAYEAITGRSLRLCEKIRLRIRRSFILTTGRMC